jgi:hypothetical protein
MATNFTDSKLESEVAQAMHWLSVPAKPGETLPGRIVGYCSEQISQIEAIANLTLHNFSSHPRQALNQVMENLQFHNGVIGRVAELELGARNSTSYTHFFTEDRRNYVDIFLERVGYVVRK